jgi:adenine deaminase
MTASCLLSLLLAAGPVEADVVLRGGTIHDGTGKAGHKGDVALKGDRIVAVGTFELKGSPRVIDCAGLLIAPASSTCIVTATSRFWRRRRATTLTS